MIDCTIAGRFIHVEIGTGPYSRLPLRDCVRYLNAPTSRVLIQRNSQVSLLRGPKSHLPSPRCSKQPHSLSTAHRRRRKHTVYKLELAGSKESTQFEFWSYRIPELGMSAPLELGAFVHTIN